MSIGIKIASSTTFSIKFGTQLNAFELDRILRPRFSLWQQNQYRKEGNGEGNELEQKLISTKKTHASISHGKFVTKANTRFSTKSSGFD
jgi:hypothetical protein